jgi:hypothetical protein
MENSIIPIINFEIDEEEIETKYKWFLDYLLPLINKDIQDNDLYTIKEIINKEIDGKNIYDNLGLVYSSYTRRWHTANRDIRTELIPDIKLYYYLKKRNIKIWTLESIGYKIYYEYIFI